MKNNKTLMIIFAVVLTVLILGLIFFLPSLGGFSSKDTTRWTVSRFIIGKVSAMDQSQAQALISTPIDIKATEINFMGKSCQNLVTTQETVNSAEYLTGTWQTTPSELGINQSELKVVKTNCEIPGLSEYIVLETGQLIINQDGVFFVFDPK